MTLIKAKVGSLIVVENKSTLYFKKQTHKTMKISNHKNNLKIGNKKTRHGSLQINSKQQSLNKKDLMINR